MHQAVSERRTQTRFFALPPLLLPTPPRIGRCNHTVWVRCHRTNVRAFTFRCTLSSVDQATAFSTSAGARQRRHAPTVRPNDRPAGRPASEPFGRVPGGRVPCQELSPEHEGKTKTLSSPVAFEIVFRQQQQHQRHRHLKRVRRN